VCGVCVCVCVWCVCVWRVCVCVCVCVCQFAWNNSAPTGRIFKKFDIRLFLFFFRKSVEKIKVALKSDKNNGYFT